MHDLVVAVHRRLEGPHHPGQGLDGHLDAGAEAAGSGEQHLVDAARSPDRRRDWSVTRRAPRSSRSSACPRTGLSPIRGPSCRSRPVVVAVAPGSPAARRGVAASATRSSRVNGEVPAGRHRVAAAHRRGRASSSTSPWRPRARRRRSTKRAGEPLGVEVQSPCSTRSAPATTTASSASSTSCRQGMRKSLYLKDDDYRLSFLYGNFTTLTRFTEADLERVITERLSPLHVQHPRHRPRGRAARCCATGGARTSLRWLRALLDHGIEVHGQIVRVPGRQRRRGARRHARRRARPVPRAGVGRRRAARHLDSSTPRPRMRPHTARRGRGRWSTPSTTGRTSSCTTLGRRLVYAADEYYLLAERPVPGGRAPTRASRCTRTASAWPARSSSSSTAQADDGRPASQRGFFAWVDGAPPNRAPPTPACVRGPRHRRRTAPAVDSRPRRSAPVGVLTGDARRRRCIAPLRRRRSAATDVRVIPVEQRVLRRQHRRHRADGRRGPRPRARRQPDGHRYLLPDVCLSERPVPRRHHRSTTCRDPSRSSPPTAPRCARPWSRA